MLHPRRAGVTVRDTTERPETIECGSNVLAGVGGGELRHCLEWACGYPRTWQPPAEYLVPDVSATVAGIVLGHIPTALPAGVPVLGASPSAGAA